MSTLPSVNVSFAGCGFLGLFHVGSIRAFRENASRFRIRTALGASAGAIAALALVADVHEKVLKEGFLEVTTMARSHRLGPFNPQFDINKIFRQKMTDILPDDVHELVNGRLVISITDVNRKNKLVSQFESKQDLIDCVICSCFLPGFSSYQIPLFRGRQYFDGGLSNNQPIIDNKTITISPLVGDSDISPKEEGSSYLPKLTITKIGGGKIALSSSNMRRILHAFLPEQDMQKLYQEGYEETQKFIYSPKIFEKLHEEAKSMEEDEAK